MWATIYSDILRVAGGLCTAMYRGTSQHMWQTALPAHPANSYTALPTRRRKRRDLAVNLLFDHASLERSNKP